MTDTDGYLRGRLALIWNSTDTTCSCWCREGDTPMPRRDDDLLLIIVAINAVVTMFAITLFTIGN